MAKGVGGSNSYEEARKKQIEDNKKRLEDLGIAKMTKSLSEVANREKQSLAKMHAKPRLRKTPTSPGEVRRSSRARNTVSYKEEVVYDMLRKGTEPEHKVLVKEQACVVCREVLRYIARPLEEIKLATYEQRCDTMERAEIFQSELERKSEHPSCVKSMVRSHVYSCFWLGLPNKFCESHLSMNCEKWEMVLVDEKGEEYDAVYLPKRTGLSGGWKAFALDHKLDDGDAVVLELIEPARFKVYIFRVSDNWDGVDAEEIKEARQSKSVKSKKVEKPDTSTEYTDENMSEEKVVESKARGRRTRNLKRMKKSDTDNEDADEGTSEEKGVVDSEARTRNLKRIKKTDADNGDSDDSMTEEKGVVVSKARGRTRNSKRAKKTDTHDVDVDENASEEKDVVVDTTATGRRTRNSRRFMKSATDN